MPDPQQMMYGPLTAEQAERAQWINSRCAPARYGERIIRIVDDAPPLTRDQLSRLALLLRPDGRDA